MAAPRDYAQPKKGQRKSASASPRRAPAKPAAKKGASKARSVPAKPAKPAAAPRKPFPWKLLLVTLAAVGSLVFVLNQLAQVKPDPVAALLPPSTSEPVRKVEPKPAVKPVKSSKPVEEKRFEFYEMLPETEVKAPKVEAYKSTPKTAKLPTKYLLQAGSFRNASDAESMKAQLILLGLPNVSATGTSGQNGTWYRVRTGPFETRSDLEAAIGKMVKLNIQPLRIKAD